MAESSQSLHNRPCNYISRARHLECGRLALGKFLPENYWNLFERLFSSSDASILLDAFLPSRCLSLFWIGASPSKCLPLLGRCILVGRFLSLDCSTRPQDSHPPFGNAEKTIEKSRREFSNRATSTAYLRIHNCQLRSNEFQVI